MAQKFSMPSFLPSTLMETSCADVMTYSVFHVPPLRMEDSSSSRRPTSADEAAPRRLCPPQSLERRDPTVKEEKERFALGFICKHRSGFT